MNSKFKIPFLFFFLFSIISFAQTGVVRGTIKDASTNEDIIGATIKIDGTTIGTAYGGTGLTSFGSANYALYSTSSSALAAGTLPIAAGGTAKTSFTANQVLYGSLSQSANLYFDGTDLSLGGQILLNNNNYIGFKNVGNTSVTSSIFNDTSNNFWFYNGNATSTIFYTNAAERMRITSAGSVGIGTTSPVAPLNVVGQTSSTSTPILYLQQGGSSPGYGYAFKIDNVTTGNLLLNRYGSNTNTDLGTLLTVTTVGAGCDSTSCTGSITILIPNATPNNVFTVLWSDGFSQTVSGGMFGASIVRANLCAGVYMANISDNTTGTAYTVTGIIGTAQGCVWPGDADDNTTVNNWDMLPISLTYGESGPVRVNATTNWIGQTAADWTTANPIANLPNYKHIDCNGDGIINQLDQAAVQQNYGQSYFRGTSSLAGTLPFFIQSVSANEGDRLSLPINLGAATDIATDVYGAAFTINYDPAVVEAGSVSVDYLSSWLGTNLMDIQFDFSQSGKIEVAVARKDRINTTGFGEIGKMNFTIRDDILRNSAIRNMDLTISNIRLIRNDNTEIGTNPQTGVVSVNTATGIENSNGYSVAVFPNPAKGLLNIHTENAQIESINMYNISGQLVKQLNNVNSNNSSFNVNELSQGVYMIQITTDKGVENRKVVIE